MDSCILRRTSATVAPFGQPGYSIWNDLVNLWTDRAVQFYHEQDAKEPSPKKGLRAKDGRLVEAGSQAQKV